MGRPLGGRSHAYDGVSAAGYDAARFEPKAAPDFIYEIEVLSGAEGKEIDIEQARAIRDFLLSVRAKRLKEVRSGDISEGTEETMDGNALL